MVFWELADYGGSHAELRFSGAELAEHLCDRHSLDATTEHCVKVFAARGDAAHLAADVAELGGGDEVVGCGLSEWVNGAAFRTANGYKQIPEKTVEERGRTAHFVAASLTFSVFCSEKPEQVIETQLISDGWGIRV